MNKVAHYLQQHLNGEILSSPDALRYFSTDESILRIQPMLVVYPRGENDIRKTARFTWQLAEKGRIVPITPRGMGTDRTGAALGRGIVLAMPAHMNRIIEFDPKSGVVTAEAGISLDKIQQTLFTHGRFLPPVSVANKNASLGGAVANDDSGRSSYKYGPMQRFVRSMRVVLANGELIETSRISKRELNKKLGLASFEGEIYRSLDKLIEESTDTLASLALITDHSAAGYNISDVKLKDGSFDLTPIFIGAQGTLGTIVEVTLDTQPYNPTRTLLIAGFAERHEAWQAMQAINGLKHGPAAADFVDTTLLKQVKDINAAVLSPLEGGEPAALLFFEIDDESIRLRKKVEKKIVKLLKEAGAETVIPNEETIDQWERLRDLPSLYLTHGSGAKRVIPILDDAQVPIERMTEFFKEAETLLHASGLQDYAIWGQAGTGLLHVAVMMDIASIGDRQKMFKVMDAYYALVSKMGGSIAGEYAEGRLRSLFLARQFDQASLDVFNRIKAIFDPLQILNPGVKVNTGEDLKPYIRDEYSLHQQYDHLPRS